MIPPYQKHTFWNDVKSGMDLDVNIKVRGGDNPGFDEQFVVSRAPPLVWRCAKLISLPVFSTIFVWHACFTLR